MTREAAFFLSRTLTPSTISDIVRTARHSADRTFGIPGIHRRRKMSRRLLKKKHLFPFTGFVAEVGVKLCRAATIEDYPEARPSADIPESDGVLIDLLVDLAEEVGIWIVIGSASFEAPLRIDFLADASEGTPEESVGKLIRYAERIRSLSFVSAATLRILDGWHLNDRDECFPYAELSF